MYRIPVYLLVLWSTLLSAAAGLTQEPFDGQIVTYEAQKGKMLTTAGQDWGKYTGVVLDKATVKFRDNWAQDQKRIYGNFVRESDIESIKAEMSEILNTVITQALLKKADLTLTTESGDDVLRLSPRIEKLDVYWPARVQNYVGHRMVDSQGSLVLVMDISDSASGELLASAVKMEKDPEKGYMEDATSASNKLAFRQMMDRWATWFFEMFEVVRNGTTQ